MKQIFKKTIKLTTCIVVVSSQMMGTSLAVETMAPIVVTAGRISENPANVSSAASVITREDIVSSQATNVAELLRSQAGLDVASSGGAGKDTSVFIRGGNSGHTLVLIDGVRVGSVTLGQFDWGSVPVADIERIEIVRGSQSSLYGADAIGGVVQLFTRKGSAGLEIQTSVEAGTYGTKTVGVSTRGTSDTKISYAVSAESFETDGFSTAANGVEADPFKRTTLSGHVGFSVGNIDAELVVRNVDGETSLDGFDPVTFTFGDVLNYSSQHKQNVSSVKITDIVSDTFESSIQVSRSTDKLVASDPVTAWNNADFKTTIDQLTWQNHFDWVNTSLLLGVDVHKDSGVSQSAGLDKSINQKAAFASLRHGMGQVDFNASVRMDKNSATSNQTTYKLGSIAHIIEGLSLSANLGTGFRAPTINDLYFPDDGFGNKGNLNLLPETSRSWDVGVDYQMELGDFKSNVALIWFHQSYSDLIAWEMDPVTFGYSPANVNQASSKGLEFATNVRGELGFIQANWTSLEAIDDTTGLWLIRRAQDSGSVTFGADISGVHAELQMFVVGKRFDDAANTLVMESYKKTDVRLSYVVDEVWKLKLRVENAVDTKYEEASGYGVAGRATYAGVSATF